MAERAKRVRGTAKGTFTRCVGAISKALNNKLEIASIKMLAEDVEKAWNEVQLEYQEYISAVEEYEEEVEDNWIGPVEETFRKIRIQVIEYTTSVGRKRLSRWES